ncbi:uncharacterized protein METZ01_LOCUS419089 [marine metagenome]|uniref:Uncharacterized protein n=1 Tax=marine metagenome TaxID=408172 RepID=A0A382X6K6_9ZZZZ
MNGVIIYLNFKSARDWTRTSTILRSLTPEASVYTNFTTRA